LSFILSFAFKTLAADCSFVWFGLVWFGWEEREKREESRGGKREKEVIQSVVAKKVGLGPSAGERGCKL
jgi:hypothetical protein